MQEQEDQIVHFYSSLSLFNSVHPQKLNFVFLGCVQKQENKSFHFYFSLSHFNFEHPQKLNFVFQGRVQKQQTKTFHFYFPLSLFIFLHLQKLLGPRTRARKRVRLLEPTWSSHSVASSLLSSTMTRWHESF